MKIIPIPVPSAALRFYFKYIPSQSQVFRRHYSVVAALKQASVNKMGGREELDKIASKVVLKVPEGDEVEMKSLWKDQRCVITYLRRFG